MSFLVTALANSPLVKKLKAMFRSGDWKDDLQNLEDELSEEMDVEEEDDQEYKKRFTKWIADVEKSSQEQSGSVILYRALVLDDINKWLENISKGYVDIDKYGVSDDDGENSKLVGTSWSYKKSGAVAYWGKSEGKQFKLEALVPIKAIDLHATVAAAVIGEEHEAEIRVKDYELITLLRAFPEKGKPIDLKKTKAKT